MKFLKTAFLSATIMATGVNANAEEYVIDHEGAHASVNFKISHLGYSFIVGRFNEFSGTFNYDAANFEGSSAKVVVKTASVDSNHLARDKHLKGADFLDVEQFPDATFVSTSFEPTGDDEGVLSGNLTLHGVTKPVQIDVEFVGEGTDPWGGYRAGFVGFTAIALKDFGIDYDLGPASATVDLEFHVEGIRQ